MANHVSMTGSLSRDAYNDLLNKAIDVVFMRRDEHIGVLAQFFDVDTKDSGLSHIISSVSSVLRLPQENEDTEALPYDAPVQGFDKTFVLVNYRLGIRVTDTMLRADRFSRIMQMTQGVVKSGMRKDEYLRAAIINGAFSGSGGADGSALCANSHAHADQEGGTWDNLGTGALTGANLQALVLLSDKLTNEKGYPDPATAQNLLVPPDLRQKALELTGSAKRAEDALNGDTVIIDKLGIVVSPFLTSTTAYFTFGDRTGFDKGLHEIRLMDWAIGNNSPANADIVVDKRIKSIKTFGFTLSQNITGSAGT